MRMNRLQRKIAAKEATQFWRVTPLFQNEQGEIIAGNQTYVIHTEPKDLLVVTVPAGAVSGEVARRKEQELMNLAQKDVIVTSDNVKFLAVERLTAAEAAAAFPKGIPNERKATPDATAEAATDPGVAPRE